MININLSEMIQKIDESIRTLIQDLSANNNQIIINIQRLQQD